MSANYDAYTVAGYHANKSL